MECFYLCWGKAAERRAQQGGNREPSLSAVARVFSHTNHTPVDLHLTRAEQARIGALHSSQDDLFQKHKSDHVNYASFPSSNFYNFQISCNKISLLNSATRAVSSASFCFFSPIPLLLSSTPAPSCHRAIACIGLSPQKTPLPLSLPSYFLLFL